MNIVRVATRIVLTLAGIMALPIGTPPLGAVGKDGDEPVTALELTKVYAENAADFDKRYKGKTLTIEGVVSSTAVKLSTPGKTYLMIDGYTKPGNPYAHMVRCEESGPDFEGIRTGHKVRIRGTVQGHSDTSVAAEMRDCKVVKVFADDYPPSKAVREEVKKLQGKWKVVSGEAGGKKLEPTLAGFDTISVEGYGVNLHQGKQVFTFGLTLNPGKTPSQIDLVGGKATLPCIYVLDGDQLRLALPPPAKGGGFSRPESFDTTKTQSLVLHSERQK